MEEFNYSDVDWCHNYMEANKICMQWQCYSSIEHTVSMLSPILGDWHVYCYKINFNYKI